MNRLAEVSGTESEKNNKKIGVGAFRMDLGILRYITPQNYSM
jgi:hypothetical protein